MTEHRMRDSLIKGTLILALAAFVARFLGMLLRAPLLYLIGEEGMAAYNAANSIYLLLLIVATAGIPSTLSKMISERLALQQHAEAKQIYKAAIQFAITTGLIMTVFLYFVAPVYAHLSKIEESVWTIRAIAPAMLLFPLIAIMRGYFQGRQIMRAGGLSQIFEQLIRVITAILFAYLLLKFGMSVEWVAAGASFGTVTGSIAAFCVMIYFSHRLRKQSDFDASPSLHTSRLGTMEIYRDIFKLSIPISFISMTVPAVNLIDSTITVPLLQSQVGLTEAKQITGILGAKAQSLAGIPPILAIAFSTSILPIISSAFARQDFQEVSNKTSQTLRLAIIAGVPLVLVLCVGARSVNGLLFPSTEGTAMIIVMVLGSIFQIMMMISASVLMGLGRTKEPSIHVLLGIGIKLLFSWLLSIWLGVYGIIVASSFCYILIFMLNVRTLKQIVPFRVLFEQWRALIGTSLVVLTLGLLLELGINPFIQTGIIKLDYLLQFCFIGLIMGVSYFILALKWQVVPEEDLKAMPAPIRKWLHKLY